MFIERRKHKRYKKDDITVTLHENTTGEVLNISIGGMCCLLNSVVPTMHELQIDLKNNSSKISLIGTCISCESPPLKRSSRMIEFGAFEPRLYEAHFYFNTAYFTELTRNDLKKFIGI